MTEYISRNEAIKIIGNAHFPEEEWDTENNASYALKLVRDYIPTADVVEVVHGCWETIEEREYLGVRCSNCQKWFNSETNYCPNCGSKNLNN